MSAKRLPGVAARILGMALDLAPDGERVGRRRRDANGQGCRPHRRCQRGRLIADSRSTFLTAFAGARQNKPQNGVAKPVGVLMRKRGPDVPAGVFQCAYCQLNLRGESGAVGGQRDLTVCADE